MDEQDTQTTTRKSRKSGAEDLPAQTDKISKGKRTSTPDKVEQRKTPQAQSKKSGGKRFSTPGHVEDTPEGQETPISIADKKAGSKRTSTPGRVEMKPHPVRQKSPATRPSIEMKPIKRYSTPGHVEDTKEGQETPISIADKKARSKRTSSPGRVEMKPHPVRQKSPATRPSFLRVTKFGPHPKFVVCPKCRREVLTTIKVQPSMQTHLIAIVLLLFLCWPCVCIPYCVDSCQNTNHYCPKCDELIGTYNGN